MPCSCFQTMSLAGSSPCRRASRPAASPRMPRVAKIRPSAGRRPGHGAAAHQSAASTKAACRRPDRRRRAGCRPSRPVAAGRRRRPGWASCRRRTSSACAPVIRIALPALLARWPGRGPPGSSAACFPSKSGQRILHADRDHQVADTARGCWRAPTRSCRCRSRLADCAASAACRRSRRPPGRRCRSGTTTSLPSVTGDGLARLCSW